MHPDEYLPTDTPHGQWPNRPHCPACARWKDADGAPLCESCRRIASILFQQSMPLPALGSLSAWQAYQAAPETHRSIRLIRHVLLFHPHGRSCLLPGDIREGDLERWVYVPTEK